MVSKGGKLEVWPVFSAHNTSTASNEPVLARDRTMLAEHAWNIPSPTENWYSGPSGYAMTLFVSTTGGGAPGIPLPQSPVPGVPGCLGGGGGSTNIA